MREGNRRKEKIGETEKENEVMHRLVEKMS